MTQKEVGRLAFRREGRNWVAYWARPDTMEGALFLGSVPFTVVEKNKKLKEDFMQLMRDVVSTVFPNFVWSNPPQPAPEHERSGNA